MYVPDWSDEVIAEKVNKQFEAHAIRVQVNGELTEYGNFVISIGKILINSLDAMPGGILLKMFLTELTFSALLSIIGAAITIGILGERAGWFKADMVSHEEFTKPLDISSN